MTTSVNQTRRGTVLDWDKLVAALVKAQPTAIELAPATIQTLSELIKGNRITGTQDPKAFISTGKGMTPSSVASFTLVNIGEATGFLDGIPVESQETNSWSASTGKVLRSVPFDATGTKFKITYVVDAGSSSEPQGDDLVRPLILVHEQDTPATEVVVKHGWGVDPLSVLVTTADKSKAELSWQFSEDANSVKFRSSSLTTFRAILLGFAG